MTDLPEVDIQDESERLEWNEVRGALYRESYSYAFGEGDSDEWRYLITADLLGDYPLIDAFSLGQLAEQRGIFADNGPYVEPDQRLEALRELAFDESRCVARALKEQWGENELFFSLYVSNREGVDEDDSDNDELYGEVLNSGVDYGAGKGQAYSWVADGMCLYARRIG